jgi:hypothetical protein
MSVVGDVFEELRGFVYQDGDEMRDGFPVFQPVMTAPEQFA